MGGGEEEAGRLLPGGEEGGGSVNFALADPLRVQSLIRSSRGTAVAKIL